MRPVDQNSSLEGLTRSLLRRHWSGQDERNILWLALLVQTSCDFMALLQPGAVTRPGVSGSHSHSLLQADPTAPSPPSLESMGKECGLTEELPHKQKHPTALQHSHEYKQHGISFQMSKTQNKPTYEGLGEKQNGKKSLKFIHVIVLMKLGPEIGN